MFINRAKSICEIKTYKAYSQLLFILMAGKTNCETTELFMKRIMCQ